MTFFFHVLARPACRSCPIPVRGGLAIAAAACVLMLMPAPGWAQMTSGNAAGAPGPVRTQPVAGASAALEGDLVLWFQNSGHPGCTRVRVELLRPVPGFNRTHAWVTALDGATELVAGAMRIGRVERDSHEVIEWFPRAAVLADPAALDAAFPRAIVPLIVERARAAQ
jgi:hypothetical protein